MNEEELNAAIDALKPAETHETSVSDMLAGKKNPASTGKWKGKEDDAKLSELLLNSRNTVFFSGAGISASAGIGTFQGHNAMGSLLKLREEELDWKFPTYAHRAIAKLVQTGHAKFVTTSNHDNMHRKSGVDDSQLAELFGNAYVEKCLKCSTLYQRHVVCPATNRKCDDSQCGGRLVKTGVRYGQETPQEPLQRAAAASENAELAVVLGSSMATAPFCEFPRLAQNMILCSLSPTNADKYAALVYNSSCDAFMEKVLRIFNVQLDPWRYSQPYRITCAVTEHECTVNISGVRSNEPVTCIDTAEIQFNGNTIELERNNISKNYAASFRAKAGERAVLTINFQASYEVEAHRIEIEIAPFQLDREMEKIIQ